MDKKTGSGDPLAFRRTLLQVMGCSTDALDRPEPDLFSEEQERRRAEMSKTLREMALNNLEFTRETKRQARRDAIFFGVFKWAVIILTFVACWFFLFVAPAGFQILLGL